jgi:putative sterol carrier protein
VADQTARQYFETLSQHVDPEKAAQVDHTYAFDITDVGQWTVDVRAGGVKVEEGLNEADVTISTSEDVFMRIVSGEQNPTTAYMTGKMKMKGNIGAAMKLSKLF